MILIDQAGNVTSGQVPPDAEWQGGVYLGEITVPYRDMEAVFGDPGDMPGWAAAVTSLPTGGRTGIVTVVHFQKAFDPMKDRDLIASWHVTGPDGTFGPVVRAVRAAIRPCGHDRHRRCPIGCQSECRRARLHAPVPAGAGQVTAGGSQGCRPVWAA